MPEVARRHDQPHAPAWASHRRFGTLNVPHQRVIAPTVTDHSSDHTGLHVEHADSTVLPASQTSPRCRSTGSHRVWRKVRFGLIQFRGHFPKGGYDVPHVPEPGWRAAYAGIERRVTAHSGRSPSNSLSRDQIISAGSIAARDWHPGARVFELGAGAHVYAPLAASTRGASVP